MKAKFIGTGGDTDPEVVKVAGVEFPRGKAVEVPVQAEAMISRNSHFEVVAEAKKGRKNADKK